MARYLILLFLLLSLIPSSHADTDQCSVINRAYLPEFRILNITNEVHQRIPPEFYTFLSDSSDLKINWLNFGNLEKEIKDLTFCTNLSNKPIIGSGSRTGSVYFTKEKTVIFNFKSYKNKLGSGLNLLHEILGALGYPDENYQITTALYTKFHNSFFSEESSQTILNSLESFLDKNPRNFENRIFEREGSSGGVTGVGGGGDADLIPLKAFALNMALSNKDFVVRILNGNDFDQFFNFLFNLQIEPESEISPDFKTPYGNTGIFMAIDKGESLLLITKEKWTYLLNYGNIQERSKYIFNIVLSAATLYQIRK